jgi:hypothetical protein
MCQFSNCTCQLCSLALERSETEREIKLKCHTDRRLHKISNLAATNQHWNKTENFTFPNQQQRKKTGLLNRLNLKIRLPTQEEMSRIKNGKHIR